MEATLFVDNFWILKNMRITKLLSTDSAPAQALVDRALPIELTMVERIRLPETFQVQGSTVENALGEVRPLEVGDILVDEKGGFYKIEAAVESILKVTGDVDLMQEAVYALMARGLRVAQTKDGFAVVALPQFKEMLESVGLTVTPAQEAFEPLPLPRHTGHGGCCCGGHGHHHGEGECGCGGHGHHHGEGECGCGGHGHHHGEGECGCGGHGHHHGEGECGCGGHGHQHGEGECGCGGHGHQHGEGECGCGGHGHQHGEGECGCGGHGHHHGEGECCCGGHDHK